jgi:hypothetical protein
VTSLTFCSKSRWHPAIRREHAFARMALAHDIEVTFIESPDDIRGVRGAGARTFVRALGGTVDSIDGSHLSVVGRAVPVPGHRGRAAEALDNALLRRILARTTDPTGPVVCSAPWQWPSMRAGRRRVFDCTDDWTRLFPSGRTRRFHELFARIADEADQVVVVAPELVRLFPGREVSVVANGADPSSVAAAVPERPGRRSVVYVGTLSERFDVAVVERMVRDLPDWTLDLFGSCHYAGSGDRPGPELAGLLDRLGPRVRWHGAIDRAEVAGAIDRADVVVIPNRADLSDGQSSMKLFDSAARGRPAVVSPGVNGGIGQRPPGTYEAGRPDEWAPAVLVAAAEPDELAGARIAWARANTWDQRWPAWSTQVFGTESTVGAVA